MIALLTIKKCQSLYEDYMKSLYNLNKRVRKSSDFNAGFSFTQLTFVYNNYEVLTRWILSDWEVLFNVCKAGLIFTQVYRKLSSHKE